MSTLEAHISYYSFTWFYAYDIMLCTGSQMKNVAQLFNTTSKCVCIYEVTIRLLIASYKKNNSNLGDQFYGPFFAHVNTGFAHRQNIIVWIVLCL